MKVFLIILFVISSVFADHFKVQTTFTLSELVDEAVKMTDYMTRNNSYEKYVDDACVRNNLKLPEYNEKVLKMGPGLIIFYGVVEKCWKSNDANMWDLLMNVILSFYKPVVEHNEKMLNCFRWKLQVFEPTSKLIEGFNLEAEKVEVCREIIDGDRVPDDVARMERYTGNLVDFTCGAINVEEVKKMAVKLAVLTSVKQEDVKKIEIDAYKNDVEAKFRQIYDCVKNTVDFL